MASMLGIIGGTALNRIADLAVLRREIVATPYGEPSAALTFGRLGGAEVVFLARHGDGHTIAPHRINYRANIWALQAQGVRDVVAVATVGGIRDDLTAGTLLVPDERRYEIVENPRTVERHGMLLSGQEWPEGASGLCAVMASDRSP